MGRSGRGPGVQSIAAGAVALAAAGLLAKALSAVARVLIARWLGAETVGLYEMAAPVLATGISLCTLGLPVATSALVAAALGRGQAAWAVGLRRATRGLLLGAGAAATLAVEVSAPALARLFGNPLAAGALRAVGPAILAAAVLAGEKAWLQGSGRVAASAAVLAAEQAVRVAALLWVGLAFVDLAVPHAAAAATWLGWSPGLGAAGGLLACLALDRLGRAGGTGPPAEDARPSPGLSPWAALLRGGLPNWASGSMATATTAIDVPLITWRLRTGGMDTYAATAALGRLNGMALPLAVGPAVLYGALSSALVPAVATDWARGGLRAVRRRGEGAYFWVLAVGAPCTLALWQLAQPLTLLLYRSADAAVPLAVLALVGVPLAVGYVAAALANAVGRPEVLLPGVFSGALVKTGLVLLLAGPWGVRGAALGTLAGFAVSTALNVRAVHRLAGVRPPWLGWAAVALPALGGQLAAAWGMWGALGGWVLGARVLGAGAGAAAAYALVFGILWWLFRTRLGLPERLPLGWPGGGGPRSQRRWVA